MTSRDKYSRVYTRLHMKARTSPPSPKNEPSPLCFRNPYQKRSAVFGNYLLPNLVLDETEQRPLGKYGRLRKRYLKEHRCVLYTNLLVSDKLGHHLVEIDKACEERMELLTKQMARREGVTEALKAANQMEWVARMNSVRDRAEEIVLHDLVYC